MGKSLCKTLGKLMKQSISKILLVFSFVIVFQGFVAGESILIQSTTSTNNSGFFEYILPIIEKDTGISANVIAVGTGAAIKNAERCNGDLLIVHAKTREQAFVEAGFGETRENLMYNDFVLVGPRHDPANIKASLSILEAFNRIALNKQKFVSRGDDSGTNIKELNLWAKTNINPQNFSGDWYLETGSGMGTTLNIGVELNAYTFTDRATWISFGNKQNFRILFEGDKNLFNQYGVIPISPSNCPETNIEQTIQIVDWLTSRKGKDAIKNFKLNGQQLFFTHDQ